MIYTFVTLLQPQTSMCFDFDHQNQHKVKCKVTIQLTLSGCLWIKSSMFIQLKKKSIPPPILYFTHDCILKAGQWTKKKKNRKRKQGGRFKNISRFAEWSLSSGFHLLHLYRRSNNNGIKSSQLLTSDSDPRPAGAFPWIKLNIHLTRLTRLSVVA